MSAPKFIEIEGVEFAADSPLEGAGFESSVPRPWRAQLAQRGIG